MGLCVSLFMVLSILFYLIFSVKYASAARSKKTKKIYYFAIDAIEVTTPIALDSIKFRGAFGLAKYANHVKTTTESSIDRRF